MCWKPPGSCRQPLDPRRQVAQRAMRLLQFVVGLQANDELEQAHRALGDLPARIKRLAA